MSGLTGSPLLRPAGLLASLTETFTSGLSTDRSPSPLPDMTTVATGRFHRRVFHPLDLQLASLHWIRAFAGHSVLTCGPLRPRGVRRRSVPGSDVDIGLRRVLTGSALPTIPQSVSRGGSISWLQWFAHCYGLPSCLPPSRPGELHPEPLTDPDMKLSPHPARATPRKPCRASPRQEFLRFPVDSILTWWPAPFAPRALPRFLTTTRQCAPDRCIRTFGLVGHPLAPFPLTSPTRFSSSVRKPR